MSTPRFHSLQVSDIRQETPHCVSIAFHIPENLQEAYQFRAGQYITIRKTIGGEELRRSYSLCSSPSESDFRIAVKKVKDGRFSSFACHELTVGDSLDVMTPDGKFSPDIERNPGCHYLAFAAGSGITPILSILKTILATDAEASFTLVYGNQSMQHIIFREEIEALKNRYMQRLHVIHLLSREKLEADILNGRIDENKCSQLFDELLSLPSYQQFFVCGPESMILSVKDFLMQHQVDERAIHIELFSTGIQQQRPDWKATHATETEQLCTVTIKLDDRTYDIPLAYSGESILDAALKKGADLPYACKGGVCCTCRAKIIQGEVEMEVNYALEHDEIEKGFVLTCQSHPRTERVIVDFDAR